MLGSATLTMLASSTAMMVPVSTVPAMTHLLGSPLGAGDRAGLLRTAPVAAEGCPSVRETTSYPRERGGRHRRRARRVHIVCGS